VLTTSVVGTLVGERNDIISTAWKDIFGTRRLPPAYALKVPPQLNYMPGIPETAPLYRKWVGCLVASKTKPISTTHLAYKARPLDGIWATAPYLHNGSVPTLYDLLLPAHMWTTTSQSGPNPPSDLLCDRDNLRDGDKDKPCHRMDMFPVGNREFDPRLVGFSTANDGSTNVFMFRVRDQNGNPIVGNYNSGHNYGFGLTDSERWALIEYLKTL
jgi:hypothetical protein